MRAAVTACSWGRRRRRPSAKSSRKRSARIRGTTSRNRWSRSRARPRSATTTWKAGTSIFGRSFFAERRSRSFRAVLRGSRFEKVHSSLIHRRVAAARTLGFWKTEWPDAEPGRRFALLDEPLHRAGGEQRPYRGSESPDAARPDQSTG